MLKQKLDIYCDLYGHEIESHECQDCPVRQPGESISECNYRGINIP
jgi:hypothetical protein